MMCLSIILYKEYDMKNDKNDKIRSHIFLLLHLACNGMVTGEFIKMLRLIGTRDYAFEDVAPVLLLALGAMGLSANRAIYHYNKLYKNNQK